MNQPKTVYEVTDGQVDQIVQSALNRIGAYQDLTDKANMLLHLDYLTAAQAANIIGVKVETFRRYVRDGRIKRRPGGKAESFAVQQVYNFVKRNGTRRKLVKDDENA